MLRDLSFQQSIPVGFASDPRRYEKALIDDWLRTEFRREKKT
jgi:hypothetical protein